MCDRDLVSEGLLPLRDAARFLGCSPRKVYGLMHDGQLPFCMIGKNRKVPLVALKDFASQHLVSPLKRK
jgi:excisionase family DNA binding protein